MPQSHYVWIAQPYIFCRSASVSRSVRFVCDCLFNARRFPWIWFHVANLIWCGVVRGSFMKWKLVACKLNKLIYVSRRTVVWQKYVVQILLWIFHVINCRDRLQGIMRHLSNTFVIYFLMYNRKLQFNNLNVCLFVLYAWDHNLVEHITIYCLVCWIHMLH